MEKNSNGIILPKSYQGTSTELKDWLPLDTLQSIALKTIKDSIDKNIDLSLQRIDARPDKGMVKFVFNNHYWGIQLDGSILDIIFSTKGEIIKLFYTTIMGSALLIFTITGFWLWYGPRIMRRNNI